MKLFSLIRNGQLRRLFATVLLVCSFITANAGEDGMDWKEQQKDITPSSTYVEFYLNWANDRYNDSFLHSSISIWAGGTKWSISDFTGEIKDVKYEYKQYWVVNNTKDGMRLRMGYPWKSGNDFWVKCQIFFDNVYDGQCIEYGWSANYYANRKKDVYCSKSSKANVGISSNYRPATPTITTTGSKKFSATTKVPSVSNLTYDFYLLNKEKSVSAFPPSTGGDAVGHSIASGANQELKINVSNVESNHAPTYYFPHYTIKAGYDNIYTTFYCSHDITLNSPCYPQPQTLKGNVLDQWKQTVSLSWYIDPIPLWNYKWTAPTIDHPMGLMNKEHKTDPDGGWWLITRKAKSGTDEFVGTKTIPANCGDSWGEFTTPELSNIVNGTYTYSVWYVPKKWGQPTSSSFRNQMADDLTANKEVNMNLDFKITNLKVADNTDKSFQVSWTGTSIGNSNTYTYEVYRYDSNVGSPSKVGTVNANKSTGTQYTFCDKGITDFSKEYTYYIKISIDGASFESESLNFFSEKHNKPDSFVASTGEYNGLVMVNWNISRIDQAVIYCELYRRKDGESDSRYQLIASLSGTEDKFSYTDDGVNAGDIYRYWLVAYSKRSDSTPYGREELKTMGFASQTGSVSGSITFDTGTAVDSVKVILEDADKAGQSNYALRIDGTGSGIKWSPKKATSSEIYSNNWSTQFFISPDAMNHDAEIFSVGNLPVILSDLKDGYYSVKTRKSEPTNWHGYEDKYSDYQVTKIRYHYGRDIGSLVDLSYHFRTEDRHHISGDFFIDLYLGRVEHNRDEDTPNGHQHIREILVEPNPDIQEDGWVYLTLPYPSKVCYFDANKENFQIYTDETSSIFTSETVPNVKVPAEKYSALTLCYDGNNLIVTDIEEKDGKTSVTTGKLACAYSIDGDAAVYFGSPKAETESSDFNGYMDEIRVFGNRCLTQADIMSYYDRYLAGNEDGLVAYWKLDEGITNQDKAYDCSFINSTPNSNHADVVGANYRFVNQAVPRVLSYYALTDANGNYLIRGVPYMATGTNYTVRPFKGVHEFSPRTRSRFLNTESNTYNATDFTDVSSFPVSGIIYYDGTNYPVSDVMIYVDGSPASINGEVVKTDKNGVYSLSVPVGEHVITVKKEGHVFENDGRYPAQGTHNFHEEVSCLTFHDKTRVVVAGRVCGGSKENGQPLGLGQSVNNIGRAKIVLSTSYMQSGTGMLNVKETVKGKTVQFEPCTTARVFEGDIKSQSPTEGTVGTGDIESTRRIVIYTDPETGEYSVKLPPLEYYVESVEIINNKDSVLYEKIPSLMATDPLTQHTDSVSDGKGGWVRYTYNASIDLDVYHSTPDFVFTEKDKPQGVFGEDSIRVFRDGKEEGETIKFYDYDESTGKVSYTYDYPIYNMYDNYTCIVKVQEEYHNYDAAETVTQIVPLEGVCIKFDNALSAEDYGIDTTTNQPVQLKYSMVSLDSTGTATYIFKAGFPNIEATMGYKLGLRATYELDGREYEWKCPYFSHIKGNDNTFYGIILGNIPRGNDFVTAGPDIVEMILRDPPGTNSSTTWDSGTSYTVSHKRTVERGTSTSLNVETNVGADVIIATGIGCMVISTINVTSSIGIKTTIDQLTSTSNTSTVVRTASAGVSTSSEPEWDGPDADVFVGTSTNTSLGEVINVGLHYDGSGWLLNDKRQMSLGEQFQTTFNYTRYYIENTVIPQFEMLIAQLEADRKIDHTRGFYEKTYDLGGGDIHTFTYDSLDYYKEQIVNWEKQLALDEWQKVTAIDNQSEYLINNFSFDGGSGLSGSVKFDVAKAAGSSKYRKISNGINTSAGVEVDGIGVETQNELSTSQAVTESSDYEDTQWGSFTYTLKESGTVDALSVDVFKSPDYMGPIFRTRGGRTSGYHEPQRMTSYLTKYYGNTYSAEREIMASTKQVYVPKFVDIQKEYTNIPVGSTANVKLTIANQSEVEGTGYFLLGVAHASNPHNAAITFGGVGESNVTYMLSYGKPVTLTAGISQTDMDVCDYSLLFYLVDETQSKETFTYHANVDTVRINVKFVVASSPIELTPSSLFCNSMSGGKVSMTLSGYDLQMTSLKNIGFEYMVPGTQAWRTEVNKTKSEVKDASITHEWDMNNLIEGTYRVRAFTKSNFSGEDVYAYSDEITITKDTEAPQVLGNTLPANGVYGVGSEVSVSFNEDIVAGDVSTQSVSLTGILSVNNDDVSLYFNGDGGVTSQTKLKAFDGNNTMSFWIKRENKNTSGELIRRGNTDFGATLSIDTAGYIYLAKENLFLKSQHPIAFDKWTFVNLGVKDYNNEKTLFEMLFMEEGSGALTPDTLFYELIPPVTYPTGKFYLGKEYVGYMKDFSIWDEYRSFELAVSEMNKTKTQFTPNLIAYWPMNEGYGKTAHEVVTNNHFVFDNENKWHVESDNYAFVCSQGYTPYIILDTLRTEDDEDFSIQLWFRANSTQNLETRLFGYNNTKTWVWFENKSGRMYLYNGDEKTLIEDRNYLDNQWHRFAMTVSKANNGNAVIYIDGDPKMSCPASKVANLAGELKIGGNYWGYFDEIRVFKRLLTSTEIESGLSQKLNTTISDVELYLPFERNVMDEYNQLVTEPTFENMAGSEAIQTRTSLRDKWGYILEAGQDIVPPVKSADILSNVSYNLVKSERKLVLNITEPDVNIQGRRLYAEVRYIKDQAGNTAPNIKWDFLVSLDKLRWSQENIELGGENLCKTKVPVSVINNTTIEQNWYITNLPTWMSISRTSGTTAAYGSSELEISFSESMPMGINEGNVYLRESESGFSRALHYSLCRTYNAPDWSVDHTRYELTMNVTGQVIIDGTKQQNTHSILGAFDEAGNCVGVCSPTYYDRTDGYYMSMVIYGNPGCSPKLTFRYYDANEGLVHCNLVGTPIITFKADTIYGSYLNPYLWTSKNQIEHTVNLPEGHEMFSVNVYPTNDKVSEIFSSAVGYKSVIIHHVDEYAQLEDSIWSGELKTIEPGISYKWFGSDALTFAVSGDLASKKGQEIDIVTGWNWLGANVNRDIPILTALSDMNARTGEFIKSTTSYASFEEGGWIGDLEYITPGVGYLYYNNGSPKKFQYPTDASEASSVARFSDFANGQKTAPSTKSSNASGLHYGNLDASAYPGTMIITCILELDGSRQAGMELAAFDENGILRGEKLTHDEDGRHLIYMVVHGNDGEHIHFQAIVNPGEHATVYNVEADIEFENNKVIGTPSNPYIFKVNPTALDKVTTDDDSTELYDILGRKAVEETGNGVYIQNRRKVISRKK